MVSFYTKLSAWSNVIIAVATIIGIPLLVCEFQEIRKQGSFTEESLNESFKPLLCLTKMHNEARNQDAISIAENKTILFSPYIANYGKGILFYIGHINYFSNDEIDFRKDLFFSKLDSNRINYDWMYKNVRMRPIIPGEKYQLNIIFSLENPSGFHLYTIFFYRDRIGNLYDTIFNMVYVNSDTSKSNISSVRNESFHEYGKDEQEKMSLAVSKLHSGIGNLLKRNYSITEAEVSNNK